MTAEGTVAAGGPRRQSRSVPDRVLGAVGVGMIILALVVLIGGGDEDGVGRPLAAPPAVSMIAPADGATLTGPLAIDFTAAEELAPQPSGWGAGGFHLHLRLDGLELMPGATDVSPLPEGAYRWTVGQLEPGPHRLQLFWSDAGHQPVAGGASEVVEVEAR